MKHKLALSISFFFVSYVLHASGYYVSPVGDDAGKGSLNDPFKTISRAASVMRPGDTCYVRQGIYRETVVPLNGGSKEKPLVFLPFGTEQVVITGTDRITAWEFFKNGIYKAFVPRKITQLFVGNERVFPARYPDYSGAGMYQTSDWAKVCADSLGNIRFRDMDKPTDYWKGATCRILTGRNWIAHTGRVTGSQGDVVRSDAPWRKMNPDVYLGEGAGCIYNHMHALDHENEWLWQNDTLYYFPEKGMDLEKAEVEARTRLYGFSGRGTSGVVVKNINFVCCSVDLSEAEDCFVDSCNILFPTPFFSYVTGWIRNKGGEQNYSIDHWQGRGVTVSGTGNTVKDCYVAFSWGDGISIGGTGNRVENCFVEDCDWSATDAGAISVTGSGHLITHNTLRNAARSILVHRFCRSTDITFNNMYNAGLTCEDLGITYAYHTNGKGSQIAYNWVHDNYAHSTASGIYLDNYDTSYVVHHNVVWNCTYAIQTNKPAVNHRIVNNTVWNCKYAQWAWGREGTRVENQKVMNNLSDKPWDVGSSFSHNMTVQDPGFMDPDNGDFRLQEDSPAVDAGIQVNGIIEKYTGKAPDAGAYEYGLPFWRAGSVLRPPVLKDLMRTVKQEKPNDLSIFN